ncbi:hypothetical protein AgCh_007556 [Apium graveolens]
MRTLLQAPSYNLQLISLKTDKNHLRSRDTDVPSVNVIDGPLDTIYDFYGFPDGMYQGGLDWQKKQRSFYVHPDLTRYMRIRRGVWTMEHGFPSCICILKQIFLSVQTQKGANYHYDMGKALAPLKDEGVLIFGSGAATHNLRALRNVNSIASWAEEFDDWLKDDLKTGRSEH